MISIKQFSYKPGEHEAEKASNSYLMSVIALVAGLPLPIINLIATAAFYLGNRKGTYFVRWHCTQALLSQLSLFMVNSIGFWWTIRIIFGSITPDSRYVAYLAAILFFNLAEFIATVYTSIKTRKGYHVEWWFYSGLTQWLVSERGPAAGKVLLQQFMLILSFVVVIYGFGRIDWMQVLNIQTQKQNLEQKLGDLIWDSFEQSGQVLKDTSLINPVERMVTHLCEKNEIDRKAITLYLLKSEQVNAMALPNGHLVVFTGLVEFCDNESELFGVLGHEIAHIRHQHVMKKLIRELGLTFLFGAAGGDVNSILKVVTSTAYDRELEREADQSSVDYMAAAGIDPKPFAELIYRLRFMDSMKELIWISSHPGSEERAKNIASYSDEKKIAKQRFFKEEEWEELKKNMRGN